MENEKSFQFLSFIVDSIKHNIKFNYLRIIKMLEICATWYCGIFVYTLLELYSYDKAPCCADSLRINIRTKDRGE